jgi:hypothetical protein
VSLAKSPIDMESVWSVQFEKLFMDDDRRSLHHILSVLL